MNRVDAISPADSCESNPVGQRNMAVLNGRQVSHTDVGLPIDPAGCICGCSAGCQDDTASGLGCGVCQKDWERVIHCGAVCAGKTGDGCGIKWC